MTQQIVKTNNKKDNSGAQHLGLKITNKLVKNSTVGTCSCFFRVLTTRNKTSAVQFCIIFTVLNCSFRRGLPFPSHQGSLDFEDLT